jgi:hypothetical protein
MTHAFAEALRQEAVRRKISQPSITPSILADSQNFIATCIAPKSDFSVKLEVKSGLSRV